VNPSQPVRLGFLDVVRLGLLGVSTRKLRATLSALGISIGIATMIIVTAIPASSQSALLEQLSALGTNMLRAEPVPRQDNPIKLPETALGSVERVGPVTTAAAVANTHTVVRRSDRTDPADNSGLTVLASSTGLLDAINGKIQAGRFLDSSSENLPTVVLGYVAAARLGINTLVPGQASPLVYIDTTWFAVIGVLDPMPLAPDVERSVLVGWGAAKTLLGFDGHPTVVYVKAREEAIPDVRCCPRPSTRKYPGWCRSAARRTHWPRNRPPRRRFPRCSSVWPGWRCSSAGSGWPTRCSSRYWNAAARSVCGGRSAPPAGRSAGSSSLKPLCWPDSAVSRARRWA
jgi:putative ABC transport system permease protein